MCVPNVIFFFFFWLVGLELKHAGKENYTEWLFNCRKKIKMKLSLIFYYYT